MIVLGKKFGQQNSYNLLKCKTRANEKQTWKTVKDDDRPETDMNYTATALTWAFLQKKERNAIQILDCTTHATATIAPLSISYNNRLHNFEQRPNTLS